MGVSPISQQTPCPNRKETIMKNILLASLICLAAFVLSAKTTGVYVPKYSGTAGQFLSSNGSNAAPTWRGTETITFTPSAYVGGGTIQARRFGNVITINFEGLWLSSTSSGVEIGSISSGFPPKQRACTVCRTNGTAGLIVVMTTGKLQAWNISSGSANAVWGSITYIVE